MTMPMEVRDGVVATLEYTVCLDTGEVVDSTGACGPIAVMVGSGQLHPALEERLAGMRAGETRRIRLAARDAFGERREELVRTIPRDRLPPTLELTVGERYTLKSPDGKVLRFRLLEVGGDEVRADFNAPNAGHDLACTVTVVGVRAPTAEEEQRGRA